MKRGGRPASGHTSQAYTFRLSTGRDADVKRIFDDLIRRSSKPNANQRIGEVITFLVRQYAGLPVTVEAVPVDIDALRDQLRDELRDFVLSLITNESQFNAITEARATYQNADTEIDPDILDNILDDFVGRQEG